jgi:diguanylate cyclase (GGDEF)-like protein/PAS domain S-box-containing protein
MTITPVTQGVGNAADTHFIAIKQDITGRKRAEEALRESEERFRQLAETTLDAVLVGQDGRNVYVNQAAARLLGAAGPEKLVGLNMSAIIDPTHQEWARQQMQRALAGENLPHFEDLFVRFDGSLMPVEVAVSLLTWQRRPALQVVARDITERKRAEEVLRESEEKYRVLYESSRDAIMMLAPPEWQFTAGNQAAIALFGARDEREFVTAAPWSLSPEYQPDGELSSVKARQMIEAALQRGSHFFEWTHKKISSEEFPAAVLLTRAIYRGQPILQATVRDITDSKVSEERLQYLAYYDALTGLPNRTLLQDRLTKALASARRRKDKVALLFLDLDRFKDINDSLGHSVGDLVLKEVAERLKKWAREQDTVARLGGDEFLIVLTAVKDACDAAIAAERLMDAMIAEFVVRGHPLMVSCSLGISIFPEHGAESETLIKNADAAMYSAKESGRKNFRFFANDMNAQAVERLTLENGLRLALDKKELFLVYQPQIEIATGRIIGLEALLRWQHPELGLVPPDKFIRIAENSGLIMPIGEWVLRTACSQTRKWQDEGLLAVPVAVNVSAVQFRQEGFCELIRRVLQETGLPPQYLELELTESLLVANAELMLSVVRELKAMGLKLAIDDFGTGYSSLSYLRQFPVGKLKIDRSFIRDVAVNPDDAAITTAIISMAKSLNLKVIAEGVEDEAQMTFLRAHQCDEIQGYYFSKPLAVDKVADKLRGDYAEHVRAQASGGHS